MTKTSLIRRIALLALTASLTAGSTFAGSWVTGVEAAQKKAKQKRQLIFVDLFAEWCGWCHRFEQDVVPSEAFQKATDDMVLLRLNTEDGKDGTKLARDFGISTLPTFVLMTDDGMIAGTIRGYAPPTQFAQSLKEVESKYRLFQKRVDGESALAKDYPKRLELAKEFRSRYGLAQSETRLRSLLTETAVPVVVRDEAYYELALTQVFLKKYDDAGKTLKKFATLQTKGEMYERSRLLAGDIYVQQGNYMGAVTEFRNFKSTFPKSQFIGNVEIILPQLERQLRK